MKKITRFFAIPLILAIIIASLCLTAAASSPTDFTIKDGVLTRYTGSDTSVVIPDNLGIIKIGDYAFPWNERNEKITSISLPETVTSIGKSAFTGCSSLSSINITSKITSVGTAAFLGTAIPQDIIINNGTTLCYVPQSYETYSMPDSVTTLNIGALWSCDNLETLTVSKNVKLLGATAPEGERFFEGDAFFGGWEVGEGYSIHGCFKLSSLVIPNNLTDIVGDDYLLNEYCKNLTIYGNEGSNVQQYAKKYNIQFALIEKTATPTSSTVLINGTKVAFDAFTIDGNNYFKLRDLAMALNGSAKQFQVGWDGTKNAISLTKGNAYTPVGGELVITGNAASKTATPTTSAIYLDGVQISVTAYTIGGNNYFKLREVGKAMNFGVTWDGTANTIKVDASTGYTD